MLHPAPSLITVVAAGAFIVLAARGLPPPGRLFHLLLVETAMQFSISAYNDYFDRHVDTTRADKPVATGIISQKVAWATGLILALAALLLALPFGAWFTLLTAIGLGGGLLYDAGLKYTPFSWLPFAVAFPTLPLWAWAGASPQGIFPPQLAWVVPVGAILVLGIHLADTIPDLAADTQAGVRGLAHRLGLPRSLALCWAAFAIATFSTLALMLVVPYNLQWYLPGLGMAAALMLSAIALSLLNPSRLKLMALLLEIGALALAISWVGAITL
jgi:protoheme IX farnesyltransferase